MSQDNVTHEQIRKDTQKYKATENGIWTDSKWRDFSLAFRKPKKRMKRLLDILSAFLGGILTHPQGWEFALLNPTNLHLKGFGWSLVEWGLWRHASLESRWDISCSSTVFYFLLFFRFVGVDLFFVCLFCLLCALSVALFFRFSFCFCFFFRFVLIIFVLYYSLCCCLFCVCLFCFCLLCALNVAVFVFFAFRFAFVFLRLVLVLIIFSFLLFLRFASVLFFLFSFWSFLFLVLVLLFFRINVDFFLEFPSSFPDVDR